MKLSCCDLKPRPQYGSCCKTFFEARSDRVQLKPGQTEVSLKHSSKKAVTI